MRKEEKHVDVSLWKYKMCEWQTIVLIAVDCAWQDGPLQKSPNVFAMSCCCIGAHKGGVVELLLQVHYSKTLTEHDIKHIERHLSMKRTIRKKIMRDLQQAFVQVILFCCC